MDVHSYPLPYLGYGERRRMPSRASMASQLSIWFFVGMLCLVYGVVLTCEGGYEFAHPSEAALRLPMLQTLQPTFWWGAAA